MYFNSNIYKDFKEFLSIDDAVAWATPIYRSWFRNDQCIFTTGKEIPDLIKMYCGYRYSAVNCTLRGVPYLWQDEAFNKLNIDFANKICLEISKFTTKDNIIAYRVISRDLVKLIATRQNLIVEHGILSTGLVLQTLLEERPPTRQSLLLKILLPQGTYGAYVDFLRRRPREQEFLIPPTTTLEILHKRRKLNGNLVWTCRVINQQLRFC